MAEGHRAAARSVLDGGEHNTTLGRPGFERLIRVGPHEDGHAVLRLIGRYLDFFNTKRPHSSLGARTPDRAYFTQLPPLAAAA
jgi:transposase InsO family protein